MPTTMKDIARHLGISASTVSRALNNTGYVSQELRIQIEQAVIALEYQPNLLARSLRTQFTHMVGLIIPDLNNPHYTGVAQAVESLLAAHDYRLILSVSNEEPASELTYLQAMQKQRVAGIVISSAGGNDEYVGHLIRQGIPVIAHARAVKAKGVDSVCARDGDGAVMATRHLIALGHTRIGMVCGPQELSTGRDRMKGYLQAMKDAGIVVDERLIKIAAFQRHYGAEATAELLDLPDRPTAIFAAGGELVIGAMKTFFSKGVDVPGEISVIGFDDPDWFSFWRPPITTVAIDTEQLAQKIVELLLKRMKNHKVSTRGVNVCVPVNLVVRSSTAKCKA